MASSSRHSIVIVGGGIAGLSAAYALASSDPALDITLIEAEGRLGGKIRTETVGSVIIEAGPDSFISYKPWAIELCRKLGLSDRLTGTHRELTATYLLFHGRLIELPEGLMLLAPTRLVPFLRTPLFSPLGKLRMGLDLVIPRKRSAGDESLAGFVRRRLGQEAVDRLAVPLLAGIYAGDPERMSLSATFPQFAEMEQKYGSLIRGMLARRRELSKGAQRNSTHTMFMTLRGGLGELVEVLEKNLGRVRFLKGTRAVRLSRRKGSGYDLTLQDGRVLSAEAVILATPAFAAAELLEEDGELARLLRSIRYVSTATVSMAFDRSGFPHPLNGFGFVVADKQPAGLMACTWTSTKFPHRAPNDSVLLRCFVGGARAEGVAEFPDEALIRLVREGLRSAMGVTQEPSLVKIYRWIRANPQYEAGHPEWVESVSNRLSMHPGLFVAGAAYHGVGIPDCIRSGTLAAQAVFDYLNKSRTAKITETQSP